MVQMHYYLMINEDKITKKYFTQLQLIAPFIYPIKSRIRIRVVYFLF